MPKKYKHEMHLSIFDRNENVLVNPTYTIPKFNKTFLLYDGETGTTTDVKFIDDGFEEFQIDQDILDVIRWESEGGLVRFER